MTRSQRLLMFVAWLLAITAMTQAQSSIAGVVTDWSGAVLPGVTVSAQSNVLPRQIEVVTDSRGQYKFVNLQPGVYTVSFRLSGFDFLKRDGVQASIRETITVNATLTADEGCGRVTNGETCLTYKQVAADIPQAFRSLWNGTISDIDAFLASLPCDAISLSRSGGLIFRPVDNYTVVLFRDGHAELRSSDRPTSKRDYAGRVTVWDYGKLCYLAQRLGFDTFAQHYGANWTDAGGVTVTVMFQGRRIAVSEYSEVGPIELWALENAIDSVRRRIEWKAK